MKILQWVTVGVLSTILVGVGGAWAGKPEAKGNVQFYDSGRFSLPFSDGVRVGNVFYTAGEIGDAHGSDKVVPGGIVPESRQAIENIKTTLAANGYELKDVVKCTVFLADIKEWPAFNEVYKEYFKKPYPARSAFGGNQLAWDARMEIECIAAK
ncbi:RidA family protein [Pseudomonas fluorescens]|uniref:Rid family hydrolase n=1 Tax=Pseudomonas TaxID=286 RepID=UPI0019074CF4|nr:MULTISPECIES: Rid family hydrolase [Pseudomonas]MBD8091170.1 RidA family protein [Pseudomonas fluorescens]MBD8719084.1 RidA family protein [Pseudomonas fluorescens]MDL2183722.1 Rid family hydrolase [Pseudomonas sp. ChxA]